MGPAHRSRFRSRAAVIVTLAALPILWTPNVVVARKVVGGFRVAIPGALLFADDGWIATGYVFVWQIALFLSLGESLFAYGGALAVAALVGAIGGLGPGRPFRAGARKRGAWAAAPPAPAVLGVRPLAT